jgi:hypothetical protein
MPRNGSGVYSPPAANYPAVSGTLITAANRNAVDADLATALTGSIAVNGESVVTANIPMSGNKLTGLGAATARTDAASLANIQDGTGVYVGTVGGTADVITLTVSPAIASYVAGQSFAFIASGANTTNVTVNVSGLGAKAVTKNGSTALVAGDIASGALITITYDGTRFQLIAVGNLATFAGGTFTGDIAVPAEAYAVGWNGSNEAPTKNDVYDKIESILDGQTFTGDIIVPDEAYDATAWNGSLEVPTKNAVRDKFESLTTSDITLGTVSTTTGGTSIDFTSLPVAKKYTIKGVGLSTSGTSVWGIQLGDSGGVENTGYAGAVSNSSTAINSTTLASMQTSVLAAASYNFHATIEPVDVASNSWIIYGNCSRTDAADSWSFSFSKTLTGVLDRLRFTTTNGTNTININGGVNISYEQ